MLYSVGGLDLVVHFRDSNLADKQVASTTTQVGILSMDA